MSNKASSTRAGSTGQPGLLTLENLERHDGLQSDSHGQDQDDDRSEVESQATSMHTVLPTVHMQQRGEERGFTRRDAQWVRKHGVQATLPGGKLHGQQD